MLEVHHIFKTYEGKPLLNDISFQVDTGETICLLGASGSGKSTLLRIIAGLEDADSGFVSFDGQDLTVDTGSPSGFWLGLSGLRAFPSSQRQRECCFRSEDAPPATGRNCRACSQFTGDGEPDRDLKNRQVTDLSGGEQQRVALARALATRPRLLMFDEPLGALDRTLREELLNELRSILHQTNIPAIYVTHDQEEAFTIADRVLILHGGEIIREGTPADVWANPESAFVAEFLGLGNVFEGESTEERRKKSEWEVESDFGVFTVRCGHEHRMGENVHLLARPLSAVGDESNVIGGVVTDVIFQQDRFKVMLDNGLYVYLPSAPKIGERIEARVKVECLGMKTSESSPCGSRCRKRILQVK